MIFDEGVHYWEVHCPIYCHNMRKFYTILVSLSFAKKENFHFKANRSISPIFRRMCGIGLHEASGGRLGEPGAPDAATRALLH